MAACERRNRLASALSSRSRPSSRCSVSMYGLPNWLASYRAKKMTRRAFSVYRSNISLTVLQRAGSQRAPLQLQDTVAAPGEREVVGDVDRSEPVRAMQIVQQSIDHIGRSWHPDCRSARRRTGTRGFPPAPGPAPPAAARRRTVLPARCEARARRPTSSRRAMAARGRFRARSAPDQQRHHDVLQRGELRQQVVNLPDETDRPVAQVRRVRSRRAS